MVMGRMFIPGAEMSIIPAKKGVTLIIIEKAFFS